jgi:hypothetical protein
MKPWMIDSRHAGNDTIEKEAQRVVGTPSLTRQRFVDQSSELNRSAAASHPLFGETG